MPRSLMFIVLALTGLFTSTTSAILASGNTHNVRVNGDIQAAIDGASNGDTIQLAAGQYNIATTIDPGGKQVTILGTVDANGNPTSILDGGHTAGGTGGVQVLACENGETSETVFQNLVIQNGYTYVGGGMSIGEDSSPTLTNCMFTNNTSSIGGGMIIGGGSPNLTDCTFMDNLAGTGGGMSIGGGSPTLTRCMFSANSAESDKDQKSIDGSGGGVTIIESTPMLTECTFMDNSANGSGGGMYILGSGSPILNDCKFCGNIDGSGYSSIRGEAIDGSSSGNATLDARCVFGDFNFDGAVNLADRTSFNSLLGVCDADINGDGEVNGADLAFVLGYWGLCSAP